MSPTDWIEMSVFIGIIFIIIKPLGSYVARVYEGKNNFSRKILGPIESSIYRLCQIHPEKEMHWKEYAAALLVFSLLNILWLYIILRCQAFLPLNPEKFPNVEPALAFNIAASFITNANWQSYAGESTLSAFSQMCGLTVQNFISAAVGLSILMAFIRGLERKETRWLGNFWVDLNRGILYIFLPLAFFLALFLISQGVIQNLKPYQIVNSIQDNHAHQKLPMGPVASQVAIKQLGTNGGGYFNTNSAHPFENPNPLSNFIEMLAIIIIPAALCYTFGRRIKDTRQGYVLLIAMLAIYLPFLGLTLYSEQLINPLLNPLIESGRLAFIENLEGKETRIGVFMSVFWATLTTATSNGSVNAMLDSFLPLSGLAPLLFMDLGEVLFGGIGSGLYQMIVYVLLTVFICGLMVGRTPEYLGKKIEVYEMKMVAFALLVMPFLVLGSTSLALMLESGRKAISQAGPHGLTQILYSMSSMANNNGSAFGGISANNAFFNTLGGIIILVGRFWMAVCVLALAGSFAEKKIIPKSLGTMSSNSVIFVMMLIFVKLIVASLTFFPAFALGPIVEHLMMMENQ